jgi:hypothetical protein
MKTVYTIEQLNEFTIHNGDVVNYIKEVAPEISSMFGDVFNYRNCNPPKLAKHRIFIICRRNGIITGHLIANLFHSPFDPEVKILYQNALYAKPDSGRTAYHLFHKFIDIGKKQANHIITMLTSQTNIKPSTLNNLGFREMETLYRMEIL